MIIFSKKLSKSRKIR